jgi:hypothetical protein
MDEIMTKRKAFVPSVSSHAQIVDFGLQMAD